MTVFVVIQDCLSGRLSQLGDKPFDAVNVKKALHAEEVYSYLNHITFANLRNRLDQGTLLYPFQWILGLLVGGVGLVERRLLLGLVPMYPHQPLLVLAHDVQLVRCHVLLPCQVDLLFSPDQSLTRAEN